MVEVRLLAEWMAERGVGLTELIAASGLDDRVVAAIAEGRYTPSPQQRQRLATALFDRAGAGRLGTPGTDRARLRPRAAVRPQPLRWNRRPILRNECA